MEWNIKKNVLLSISRPSKFSTFLSVHKWILFLPTLPNSFTCLNERKTFSFCLISLLLLSLTSALNAYRMDGFDLSLLIISPRFCWNQQKKNILLWRRIEEQAATEAVAEKNCRSMLLALCSSLAIAI